MATTAVPRATRTKQQTRALTLRRVNAALGHLRGELAVVSAQVHLLASIEEVRPLTPAERHQAQRLETEYRRIYRHLKALTQEYSQAHEDRRRLG